MFSAPFFARKCGSVGGSKCTITKRDMLMGTIVFEPEKYRCWHQSIASNPRGETGEDRRPPAAINLTSCISSVCRLSRGKSGSKESVGESGANIYFLWLVIEMLLKSGGRARKLQDYQHI